MELSYSSSKQLVGFELSSSTLHFFYDEVTKRAQMHRCTDACGLSAARLAKKRVLRVACCGAAPGKAAQRVECSSAEPTQIGP